MTTAGIPARGEGPDRGGALPSSRRSARRRAREYALQGLYQWLMAGGNVRDITEQLATDAHFGRADAEYFRSLLGTAIAQCESLDAVVVAAIDRPLAELAPVEHAILLLATAELREQAATPYRVIVNEAIELAKGYGGTDGYKYVNGVLDKIVRRLRVEEEKPRAKSPALR